ncbi:MAG: hypothetical protein HZB65_05270 [Candidatus Aenigmarchaeota archaeon]|nr:hypothetical protein [Candidatus Aenigmarchaeota archaeon]
MEYSGKIKKGIFTLMLMGCLAVTSPSDTEYSGQNNPDASGYSHASLSASKRAEHPLLQDMANAFAPIPVCAQEKTKPASGNCESIESLAEQALAELNNLCKQYNRPDIVREIFSLYVNEFRIPEKEALKLTRLLAIYLDYCNDGKAMILEADNNLPNSSYYEILDLQKVLPTDSKKLEKRLDEMQKLVVSDYTIKWFGELDYLFSVAETQGRLLNAESLKKTISGKDVILVGYDADCKDLILDLSEIKDGIAFLLYNKTCTQETADAFLHDKEIDSPFTQESLSELEKRYSGFMQTARNRIRRGKGAEVIISFTNTLESFDAEKHYNPDDFVPEVDTIANAIANYRERFSIEADEARKILGALGYSTENKKQPEKAPKKTIIAPMPIQCIRPVEERLEKDGKKCATILRLRKLYDSGKTAGSLEIEGKEDQLYFHGRNIINF